MKSLLIIFSLLFFTSSIAQNIDDNPIIAGFTLNQPFAEKDMPNLFRRKELLSEPARKYYEICERNGEPKAILTDEVRYYYKNYLNFAAILIDDENVDNSRFSRYYNDIHFVSLVYTNKYALEHEWKTILAKVDIIIRKRTTGWNAGHFEDILNNFKIKFGEPTLVNKFQNGTVNWIWSGNKNILILKYVFTNSLDAPSLKIEFMTKKFYNQFY